MRTLDEERRAHIKKMATPFSKGETACGNGSTLRYTERLRDWLPDLIKRHGVKSLCDAGCGDKNWISQIDLGCEYRGFDLHFGEKLDISKDKLPDCDLILCRDVFIHMRGDLIESAISLFKQASPLLLSTSYDKADHLDLMETKYRRSLNLSREPFNLTLLERYEEEDKGKFLGLWKL